MTSSAHTSSGHATELLAFLTDEESLKAARTLAASKSWPAECIHQGTVEQAVEYLKNNPSPYFLLIEVESEVAAPEQLDQLADVCAPTVKVIVTSKVNAFSFYEWLMDLGIYQYLLQPFTAAQLSKALEKRVASPSQAEPDKKQLGKVLAFMGTRGGVGTTTILSNLAYLIDKEYHKTTAVLDMDIHFGTVAMAFDIDPTRGVAPLFEQPDRIDSLFLDRVSANFTQGLSLMSAEEPLKNMINPSSNAAETLQRITREKYSYVLVDLPRSMNPLTRSFLERADMVVLVSELTLLGLRDLLRISDYLKELHKTPLVVANREGLASKHEISRKDFEKHYGQPVTVHIPCMMEAFSTAASGEMLIETTKNSQGLAAMRQLAGLILGEDAEKNTSAAKEHKLMSWLHKDKS